MDCGVISVLKTNYRHTMLSTLMTLLPERDSLRAENARLMTGTRGIREGYAPHMLDVSEQVQLIWDKMTQKTVVRCWIKASCLPSTWQSALKGKFGKPPKVNDVEAKFCFLSANERDSAEALRDLISRAGVEATTTSFAITKELVSDLNSIGRERFDEWLEIERNQVFMESAAMAEAEEIVNYVMQSQVEENSDTGAVVENQSTTNVQELRSLTFTGISQLFAPLETLSGKCNVREVAYHLRRSKQELIRAHK